MKIRSVTAFAEMSYPVETGPRFQDVVEALHIARAALVDTGYEVETTRLATQPFPAACLRSGGPGKAVDFAKDLEALAFVHEIDYVALGPVLLEDPVAYAEVVADLLAQTESVFVSLEIANHEVGLSLSRIRRTADIVRRVSTLRDDGFANLRLAALANVLPWVPFFPAAYHGSGAPRLAIATESADLAVAAISSATSLSDARTALLKSIEAEAGRIEGVVRQALGHSNVSFQGIDFSLAPYPDEIRSIGAALERLGLEAFGGHGSLLAAAFLTDVLDEARFTRTGFCGLMLPIMEDKVLAGRAAEGWLHVTDLLAYSAVCGTGLDTIPLPGEVDESTLAAILADVAALALRLDKPLTARLMPLPGKRVGDETGFEFEYFANSRVMGARGRLVSGLLAGNESVAIQPCQPRRS